MTFAGAGIGDFRRMIGRMPVVREIYDFLDEHCEDVTFARAESYR